jgi:RNA polymerase sigma-70 factor (ECF subfamily)
MSDLDAHLVARARAGDAAAFDGLVRRHVRAAHAVALAVLGNAEDAEDACQDAFIKALERLDQCREPERFVGWLLQIVRNGARNRLRFERSRPTSPLELAAGRSSGSRPGRDAERAEMRARLLGGLATLSEVQREVVLLHDLEGWAHREIADLLGLAEGTSRFHLSVARRKLRLLLEVLVTEEER